MIRHFIVERNASPREWDPQNPDPKLPRDCLYFGKALVEMEQHLQDEEISCYLTWDNDSLPELGHHVVAILIGEESGLIPRYARHVRLVARVMGRRPFLGVRRWSPLNHLKVLLAAKHLRNWMFHLRSWVRYQIPPSSWPPKVHSKANIAHLPWGSASLVEVPVKKMQERNRNYYFSGGIAVRSDFSYRKVISSPKILARQALVDAVAAIEKKHPHLVSGQTIRVHKQTSTGELSDIRDYAQRLMDSKVCLAPRGSVADTWRFFEGLKSGCAVITNPMPDEWYYRGVPAIQIESWTELEAVLLPLLADEARLEEMHVQSLRYWDQVCGEKALGRYLAQTISAAHSDEVDPPLILEAMIGTIQPGCQST
ncbi:hypothetical protein [Acidobacterium sp. S8]|uniref:hypothetical protein n=1 Tax=Acidobacterium sp. S8 TaxID=1641854 RepID=UPI00131AF455|nr:hypothetical protein [Acidobacterium sp. S8]